MNMHMHSTETSLLWLRYPVTHGHILIIPFRQTLDYFTMTDEERLDSQNILISPREQIMRYDSTVQGSISASIAGLLPDNPYCTPISI
jgi:hypothetical protein